ncbi:hypothetical protein [Roseibium sp. SCP14]|uniref:hypothetical protein n=1 Tax=Roseibium sp. SCP14 TaxID=3141375 RepID=UPI00334FA23E
MPGTTENETGAFAISSTAPERKPDVITALDVLINEQAFRSGVGRWDFLRSLNEIDASHWAKILKGNARLTPGKFRLLNKALSENKAQADRLNELYNSYYSSFERSSGRCPRKEKPDDLTGGLEKLLEKLSVRREDLRESHVFQGTIRQAIRLPRSSGNFAEAKRNGRILVHGLHSNQFRLNPDKTEEQVIDLVTALCYAAYQTADADLFSYVVKNCHLPGEPERTTSFVQAAKLHLQRRFNEIFLGTPIEQLLDLQSEASSLADDIQESCEERLPMAVMIKQNFSRLFLQTGEALYRDRVALQQAVESCDRDGDRFTEFQALCRAYLAKWYLVSGDLDTAHTILADAISRLDRKLGKFHWARACVREYQAECILQEMKASAPSEDLAESCLGYLNDALANMRVCENIVQTKQLESKAAQVQNLLF